MVQFHPSNSKNPLRSNARAIRRAKLCHRFTQGLCHRAGALPHSGTPHGVTSAVPDCSAISPRSVVWPLIIGPLCDPLYILCHGTVLDLQRRKTCHGVMPNGPWVGAWNVRTRRRLARYGPSLRPLSREEARAPRGGPDTNWWAAWYVAPFMASAVRWVPLPLPPATRMPMVSRPSSSTSRRGQAESSRGRRWRERLALDQRPRGERIDRGWARAGAAEQLIGADRGCHQRTIGPADRKVLRRQGLARKHLPKPKKGFGNCDLDHKRKGSPAPILRAIQQERRQWNVHDGLAKGARSSLQLSRSPASLF